MPLASVGEGICRKDNNKQFVKMMAIIHNAFTLIWVIIGTFTFAPVTFYSLKIKGYIQKSWVAVLLSDYYLFINNINANPY